MTEINWKRWIDQLDRLPEDARLTRSSMTEDDIELEAIWKCAFPDRLNHDETRQLIHLLYNEDRYSFRVLAHFIGVLLGVYYVYVLNEIYGVNQIEPDPGLQAHLRQRLVSCNYYEWAEAYDSYPKFEENSIEELKNLLNRKRPCKRLVFDRRSIQTFEGATVEATINNYLRSVLSLPDTWQGIMWRELPTSIVLWDEMMRLFRYNADKSKEYMNRKEAHVLVGKVITALTDLERNSREFTNHRANGIWHPVTDSGWQYWLVTMNSVDIGVFGIEEK